MSGAYKKKRIWFNHESVIENIEQLISHYFLTSIFDFRNFQKTLLFTLVSGKEFLMTPIPNESIVSFLVQ